MPDLPTRSQSTIVSTIIAGIQGRMATLVDFGKGSPLLAITQGFTEAFLWFQALVLGVLKASRLSTSQAGDVDTFTADFMPPRAGTASPRLGATSSIGNLTYSRLTASTLICFIPVGATAQTANGAQGFTVKADPTLSTYSANPPGYTLAANLTSITVPAFATVPGAAGNAQAGTITVMTSAVVGLDSVTNAAAFIGGFDQESDSSLKKRFSDYILGLSRGDYYGLASSIEGTNINVQWTLTEFYNHDGSWRPGFFFVVADDGSGSPPAAFMQAITNAANAVRPLGTQCAVMTPIVRSAVISFIIQSAPGYDHNVLVGLAANAVISGVNTLGLGNRLDFNRIAAWAYSVPGVTSVTAVLLNSLTGDAASIEATALTQDGLARMGLYTIKCSSCSVS